MKETVAEKHPLGFFLPENTQLLMLGSFPPPQQRWSMNFYYPNIQNDMWRILGLLFYADKDFFLEAPRKFSEEKCKAFCREKGLGIGDTGVEVIRQKGNASDKFLEIVRPIDLEQVLGQIPQCRAIVLVVVCIGRRTGSRIFLFFCLARKRYETISYAFFFAGISEAITGKSGYLSENV